MERSLPEGDAPRRDERRVQAASVAGDHSWEAGALDRGASVLFLTFACASSAVSVRFSMKHGRRRLCVAG